MSKKSHLNLFGKESTVYRLARIADNSNSYSQFIRTPNTVKPTRNISALLLGRRKKKKKKGWLVLSIFPRSRLLSFLLFSIPPRCFIFILRAGQAGKKTRYSPFRSPGMNERKGGWVTRNARERKWSERNRWWNAWSFSSSETLVGLYDLSIIYIYIYEKMFISWCILMRINYCW